MRRIILVIISIAITSLSSAQTFTKLADLDAGPSAALVQANDGNFYGTTPSGGAAYGTVFKATPGGALTTLHSFNLAEGGTPYAGLVQASDGNFYGSTSTGGAHGYGTVFKTTREGTLTTVYNACSQPNCADGTGNARLIQATDGNFYGTTPGGGANSAGTVFKMSPEGVLTTLHSFNIADGFTPSSGVVQGNDGNFYGTTWQGGAGSLGTVFKITPEGALTSLHSFCGDGICGAEGRLPNGLVQGADGNFYGTTYQGGAEGFGTVFKMTPGGLVTTIHSFCMRCADGSMPVAGLVQASDGNFYGTTLLGGLYNKGTVFKITRDGTLTTLHSFCSQQNCSDGENPNATVVQATDGSIYGTTPQGGLKGSGTFFKITLPLLYHLSVIRNGSGTITSSDNTINCGDVCSYDYAPNTQVTLTAEPSPGWLFGNWSGCDNVNGNACTVTMNNLRTVTAAFTPTYPLTVAKAGNGTVTSGDGHITCGAACSYTYMGGAVVTLTATPDSGWVFKSWSGCDSVNNTVCTVTMNSPRNVTATFTATYQLTVARSGNGLVTSSDGHINCGAACSYSYLAGAVVTLTAAPEQGWSFGSWSGCDSVQNNVCSVTMNNARNVTASFTPLYLLSVVKTGSGAVTSSDGHINCGGACSYSYLSGSLVRLTAAPGQGWALTGWSGCDAVQSGACVLTMNSARTVTATFKLTYVLSVTKNGLGLVSSGDGDLYCGAACSYSYPDGAQVNLFASPTAGYSLGSWSGCDSVNGTTCVVTIAGARNVTAKFAQSDIGITSLLLNPSSVKGGNSSVATITLAQPAPAGGFAVGIATDHPESVQPPAVVVVPAGQTTLSFSIRTSPVRTKTVATVTATANASHASNTLTVNTGYGSSQNGIVAPTGSAGAGSRAESQSRSENSAARSQQGPADASPSGPEASESVGVGTSTSQRSAPANDVQPGSADGRQAKPE